MDLRETFATNLRRLRNARRWSQDELAFEAEISRSYLSKLEKGAYFVSIKIIGRIADKLDVESAECLKWPAKRPPGRHIPIRVLLSIHFFSSLRQPLNAGLGGFRRPVRGFRAANVDSRWADERARRCDRWNDPDDLRGDIGNRSSGRRDTSNCWVVIS
ncbi:helix-turn-helix transcriptional regulator [Bradyrhizobium sp. B097]|uniref:helix-turn-helix domain-containing protein n=1 Tax=Bradyrhizobium sp. B097 TaxID=3140244 RepID=UPI00318316D5